MSSADSDASSSSSSSPLVPDENVRGRRLLFWFDELGIDDVGLVGGKNASLGEMYRELTPHGVRIPNGFAVSAFAYHYFVRTAGIDQEIRRLLDGLDVADVAALADRGARVRALIVSKELPRDLRDAIVAAYARLSAQYGGAAAVDVAVRSSATAEDLPDASFAGQQETFLNVSGADALLDSCRRCFASLFTNRAISYRQIKGFDHFQVGLSIGVQKMVRSDLASSGVMFSIDTESGFRDAVLINGSWGLGENIVQGAVNPDEWYVFKPTLRLGFKPIVQRKLGSKEMRMVYSTKSGEKTRNVPTSDALRGQFCLAHDEVLTLARWACTIEDHYSTKRARPMPMDMEWAKDGQLNQLFIVQARPETVHAGRTAATLHTYRLRPRDGSPPPRRLVAGAAVGARIGAGQANVIKDVSGIAAFRAGQVLVTEMTDPDWEPILKIAAAVVTNRGGRTCHAAIISRELGIPCVVGTGDATLRVPQGTQCTVDCSRGEEGVVWEGSIPFGVEQTDLGSVPHLRTKVTMNLANPEKAFECSFLPNQGVGLARMEFIVSNHIKVHPLACLHPDRVADAAARAHIDRLAAGYASPAHYFVSKLAQGVGMLAAAFYPKPVILRFSDFKTNEYAGLVGGRDFEPHEENPMLGWRGASRYYDPRYRDGFALECDAVKHVRDVFGLTNLQVMVPFCRTTDEARRVVAEIERNGLSQQAGVKIIGMCEIPSNVLLADEFLDIFDGFSIGSNDLTQLTLGLDRDSEMVRHLYDERNPAVKRLIRDVILVARRKGKYIGICGQAPSDFPDFATFLVECGIESISLNPDTVVSTTFKLFEKEKELGFHDAQS